MASAAEATVADLHGQDIPFPEAPAPWHCEGETFWFYTYIRPSKDEPYPAKSSFGDIEATSAYADPKLTGKFKGGLALIMVVRYKASPVGPYDEVLWVPGKFQFPATGKSALRITRIYVSTKASTYNGRKNWNIPKQVAHFEFTPNPEAKDSDAILPYIKISASPVNDPSNPFFVVNLKSTRFLSKAHLPFNSNHVPGLDMTFIHPPLPESPNWKEDAKVGTDRWWTLKPLMTGKTGLLWVEGGLRGGKLGDNLGFPDVQVWKLGTWLRDFTLEFYVGEELGAKKKQD
ncbi:hypothetical protein K474DRAFT_1608129 [Panus rudis PR-1116 ss-1]|nr:hypothetical protein K474DRAFT_1608129 [Panus rudis PR-1116 ss-1]